MTQKSDAIFRLIAPYRLPQALVQRRCPVVTWRSRCVCRGWGSQASHIDPVPAALTPMTGKPCNHTQYDTVQYRIPYRSSPRAARLYSQLRLNLKLTTCKLQVTTLATCSQSQRPVQSMVSAHWLNAPLMTGRDGRGAAYFLATFNFNRGHDRGLTFHPVHFPLFIPSLSLYHLSSSCPIRLKSFTSH